VLVLHASPKGRRVGGGARVQVAARRSMPVFLKGGAAGKRARSDKETADEVWKGALGTKLACPGAQFFLVLKIAYLEVKGPQMGLSSCRAALR